jgi:hypothetical protein
MSSGSLKKRIKDKRRDRIGWACLAPEVVFRTAHEYVHVAAATTAIHGGLTLLKTTSDTKHAT